MSTSPNAKPSPRVPEASQYQGMPRTDRGMLAFWESDDAFTELYAQIKPYTLVDDRRAWILYQFAQKARCMPGHVAEIGVYRGGTARLLASALSSTDTELHLFDTFEGMPVPHDQHDLVPAGHFSDTSEQAVDSLTQGFGQVHLHPGYFPETADPVNDHTFCLVHCDVDIYQSVIDCCDFFLPRLVPSGVIIFDDYGAPQTPGAKVAIDEYFADTGNIPIYLPTGQAMVIV